jgi:uncharacterized membrane protein YbaN (DUF454 family)
VGFVALALAVLGAVLPVLPTTIFVLIAAWAFARSSPKLHQALLDHRQFGPVLRDWEAHGAIPRAAKVAAIVGMVVSFAIVMVMANHWAVPTLTGVTLLASAGYVLTRPDPPREGRDESGEDSQP